jgi:hypothetical protein
VGSLLAFIEEHCDAVLLVDSGAQVSATSSNNADCLISTIDPKDLLTLQAFDQAKSEHKTIVIKDPTKLSSDIQTELLDLATRA